MEPRAAWGAGVVLLAVTAAGSLPGPGEGPAPPPCADRELVELRGEPGDGGAFGPPRLVCGAGLRAALSERGCGQGSVSAAGPPGGGYPRDGSGGGARSGGWPSGSGAALALGEGCRVAAVSISATTALLLGRPVDVNAATAEDLERLPGIGVGLAQRVVAARERDGPFRGLEDLRRVKGLGAARIRALEGWAVTGSGGAR